MSLARTSCIAIFLVFCGAIGVPTGQAATRPEDAVWIAGSTSVAPEVESAARAVLVEYAQQMLARGEAGAALVDKALARYTERLHELQVRTQGAFGPEAPLTVALEAIADVGGRIPPEILAGYERAQAVIQVGVPEAVRQAEAGRRALAEALRRARDAARMSEEFAADFDSKLGIFVAAPILATAEVVCANAQSWCADPNVRAVIDLAVAAERGEPVSDTLESFARAKLPETFRIVMNPDSFGGDTAAAIRGATGMVGELAALTGDPELQQLADQFSVTATAALTFVDAVKALQGGGGGPGVGTVLQIGAVASGAGGIAVMAAAIGGGSDPDPAIMEALSSISTQIAGLRTEMRTRLIAIDAKLDEVLATMTSSFDRIFRDFDELNANVDIIQRRLAAVEAKVDELTRNVFEIAQAQRDLEFAEKLEFCLNSPVMDATKFDGCVSKFVAEAAVAARDAVSDAEAQTSSLSWLYNSLRSANTPQRTLPNLRIWRRGVEALLELDRRYPELARTLGLADRARPVLAPGRDVQDAFEVLLEAHGGSAVTLLAARLDAYRKTYNELQGLLLAEEKRLRQDLAAGYLLWGAVTAQRSPNQQMPETIFVCEVSAEQGHPPLDLRTSHERVSYPKLPTHVPHSSTDVERGQAPGGMVRHAPELLFVAQDLGLGKVEACYYANPTCPPGTFQVHPWGREAYCNGQLEFTVAWWFVPTRPGDGPKQFHGGWSITAGNTTMRFIPPDQADTLARNRVAACLLGEVCDVPACNGGCQNWADRPPTWSPGLRLHYAFVNGATRTITSDANDAVLASAVEEELTSVRQTAIESLVVSLRSDEGEIGPAAAKLEAHRLEIAGILTYLLPVSAISDDRLVASLHGPDRLPGPNDIAEHLLDVHARKVPEGRPLGLAEAANLSGPLLTAAEMNVRIKKLGPGREPYPPLDLVVERLAALVEPAS